MKKPSHSAPDLSRRALLKSAAALAVGYGLGARPAQTARSKKHKDAQISGIEIIADTAQESHHETQ